MSVEHLAAVLHHSTASGTDKLVLLGIANHQGDGGAWPAVSTLARYANTTERTVQRSIGRLVDAGELTRKLQAGGTLDSHEHTWQRPNRYDVTVTCPAWCDRTPNHRDTRTRPHRRRGNPQPDAQPVDMPGMSESDRVTLTSPGDADVTRGGDAGVTQTVTNNHDANHLPASTTERAREARAALRKSKATPHTPTTDDDQTED